MKKPKADYVIQTVGNALRLLQALRDEDEVGVTELSRRLALHKNNVFRLLATLELEGYVEQTQSERYRLGVGCLELGRGFLRGRPLVREARPILAELSAQVGETAHLSMLRDFRVVHLEAAVGGGLLAAPSRVGTCLPVHCTAAGKILIGSSPESLREGYDRSMVSGAGLEARTARTIVDRDKFFEHVRTAAAAGLAVDLGECETGLCCVAAPVFDAVGKLSAAISLSGPAERLEEERLRGEVGDQVIFAAERLSRAIGYSD